MTIEGLTMLSSFLSSDSRAAIQGSEFRSTTGVNVLTVAVPEDNVSNRAIAAYGGAVPPQQGMHSVHEEKDSHPFYYSEEDEEDLHDEGEEEESAEDDDAWEVIDWEEPEFEDEEIIAAKDRLAFVMAAHDRGVFLNCMG